MTNCCEQLRTSAWKTAGARYNAARRLQKRSRFSLITISLLSGAGIVVPLIFGSGAAVSNFSIFLAMLVLVVGIVETASEFSARAAALFANAEDLNAFQSHLGVLMCSGANIDVAEKDAEYQRIKRTIQVNHEPIDVRRFEVQHASSPEFQNRAGGGLRDWWVIAWYGVQPVCWLLFLWVAAIAGFILTVKSLP